jgi:hypothetical protein
MPAFAIMSMPLPKDHWLYDPAPNVPPMPFRMGTDDPRRESFVEAIRAAGKHAMRAASINGTEADLDPDALVQNFIVGMLGYFSPDGTIAEAWGNPDPLPPILDSPRP